jgi:hypothetical protein
MKDLKPEADETREGKRRQVVVAANNGPCARATLSATGVNIRQRLATVNDVIISMHLSEVSGAGVVLIR